jgi:hypothetical protein
MNRDELILAAVQGLLAAPDCDLDKVADKAIAVADQVLAKVDGVRLSWERWYGGGCPVPLPEHVNVEFRSGMISFGLVAGVLDWSHNGAGTDIVAYSYPVRA